MIKCPKCEQILVCGCDNCLVNRQLKKNEKHFVLLDGENVQCPSCAFTQHWDGWLDEAFRQDREGEINE